MTFRHISAVKIPVNTCIETNKDKSAEVYNQLKLKSQHKTNNKEI